MNTFPLHEADEPIDGGQELDFKGFLLKIL